MKTAFGAVLAVTKKVTVLIFAIFCPRGLEGAVNQVPREAVRGPQNTNGAQVVLRPVFLALRLFAAGFLRRLVELRVVQVGVEAALGEQLVVRALLDDIAVADY